MRLAGRHQVVRPIEELGMEEETEGGLDVIGAGKVKVVELVDVADVHFSAIDLVLVEVLASFANGSLTL